MANTNEQSSAEQPEFLAEVEGPRAIAKFGTLAPAFLGSTIIQLHEDRVIEYTTGPIAARECHLLATEIDSVEILTTGNPLWLLLGVLMLPVYGLGLIFLVLFFFIKHRFLAIRSAGNVVAVGLRGDEEPYRKFMFNVSKIANHYKTKS